MLIDRVYMPAEIAVNSTVEKIQVLYLHIKVFTVYDRQQTSIPTSGELAKHRPFTVEIV